MVHSITIESSASQLFALIEREKEQAVACIAADFAAYRKEHAREVEELRHEAEEARKLGQERRRELEEKDAQLEELKKSVQLKELELKRAHLEDLEKTEEARQLEQEHRRGLEEKDAQLEELQKSAQLKDLGLEGARLEGLEKKRALLRELEDVRAQLEEAMARAERAEAEVEEVGTLSRDFECLSAQIKRGVDGLGGEIRRTLESARTTGKNKVRATRELEAEVVRWKTRCGVLEGELALLRTPDGSQRKEGAAVEPVARQEQIVARARTSASQTSTVAGIPSSATLLLTACPDRARESSSRPEGPTPGASSRSGLETREYSGHPDPTSLAGRHSPGATIEQNSRSVTTGSRRSLSPMASLEQLKPSHPGSDHFGVDADVTSSLEPHVHQDGEYFTDHAETDGMQIQAGGNYDGFVVDAPFESQETSCLDEFQSSNSVLDASSHGALSTASTWQGEQLNLPPPDDPTCAPSNTYTGYSAYPLVSSSRCIGSMDTRATTERPRQPCLSPNAAHVGKHAPAPAPETSSPQARHASPNPPSTLPDPSLSASGRSATPSAPADATSSDTGFIDFLVGLADAPPRGRSFRALPGRFEQEGMWDAGERTLVGEDVAVNSAPSVVAGKKKRKRARKTKAKAKAGDGEGGAGTEGAGKKRRKVAAEPARGEGVASRRQIAEAKSNKVPAAAARMRIEEAAPRNASSGDARDESWSPKVSAFKLVSQW